MVQNWVERLISGSTRPTITAMDEDNIRPVDLLAAPALDERAVQEFARAMRAAVAESTEILGGTTRRESELTLSDILEPAFRAELDDLLGTLLALRAGGTTLGVLHLDDAQTIALADLFLGGPGASADRPPANIELAVIAASIPDILLPIVGTATFTSIDALEAVADKDLPGMAPYLVRSDITISIGTTEISGALYVRDPDRAGPAVDADQEPLVTASAATMPLSLDIELASVEMPAVEIGSLAVGDVVIFDVPADAPVTVRHDAKALFEGRVQVHNDRRLMEVTGVRSA